MGKLSPSYGNPQPAASRFRVLLDHLQGAARQVAQVFTRSNFSAFADGQFRCAGEKSRRIRGQKAPRGANSLNLRKNSSRLGYLREQKSCRSDLPRSPLQNYGEELRRLNHT
jgi:hypothetical protein